MVVSFLSNDKVLHHSPRLECEHVPFLLESFGGSGSLFCETKEATITRANRSFDERNEYPLGSTASTDIIPSPSVSIYPGFSLGSLPNGPEEGSSNDSLHCQEELVASIRTRATTRHLVTRFFLYSLRLPNELHHDVRRIDHAAAGSARTGTAHGWRGSAKIAPGRCRDTRDGR
jgi:hypothetical protein